MQIVTIRGIDFDSIQEVHEYLAEELEFPSHYGKNLDALYDVLTELPDEVHFIVDFSDMEDDGMIDRLQRMTEVIQDAAEYSDTLSVEIVP